MANLKAPLQMVRVWTGFYWPIRPSIQTRNTAESWLILKFFAQSDKLAFECEIEIATSFFTQNFLAHLSGRKVARNRPIFSHILFLVLSFCFYDVQTVALTKKWNATKIS